MTNPNDSNANHSANLNPGQVAQLKHIIERLVYAADTYGGGGRSQNAGMLESKMREVIPMLRRFAGSKHPTWPGTPVTEEA